MYKVGLGKDYHRLASNRRLVLCGVEIEHTLGLDGHSDADVAIHALIDALLGASNLGDIGEHFPPGDKKYKDISSITLLERAAKLLVKNNWRIVNLDLVILAESPKISPHKGKMVDELSKILKIGPENISLKGKTTEGMGPVGRQEGISAHCVCLLEKV